jgi:3-phosphoglycerate kinase
MKKTIADIPIRGKRVLIRVDFNVPIKGGVIADDTRISAALPTIQYASRNGAKVILCSHLGRPIKEEKKAVEKGIPFDRAKFSLGPIAARLSELLDMEVTFVPGSPGNGVRSVVEGMANGEVCLLENLRYEAGEEANDIELSKSLASLCDVYVNDAFGAAHRAHASTVGITNFVPDAVSGFLMERELKFLGQLLSAPEKPYVAILGGAKVSDKVPIIVALIDQKVDRILVGGAMAYTFLKANGYTVGKSLVEDEMLDQALEIERKAREAGVEIVLPTDHQVVDSYDPLNSRKTIPIDFTNAGLVGLDIGLETVELFKSKLKGAKTILWNGPMGMFEEKPFDIGTIEIAKAVAEATKEGAVSVVGGGDSVAAVNQTGMQSEISHISTGGGAALEFLSGKRLPGVDALQDK